MKVNSIEIVVCEHCKLWGCVCKPAKVKEQREELRERLVTVTRERDEARAEVARLKAPLAEWARWYSARLDRISAAHERGERSTEDYAGCEQDLFEALGCKVQP